MAILIISPQLSFAHLDMLYPDGAVVFNAHQLVEIKWDVYISHGPGTIKIELSTNGGTTYSEIDSGIPYTDTGDRLGSYLWTVPEVDSTNCRIKVTYTAGLTDYYNGLFSGENDPTFSINNSPSVAVALEDNVSAYTGTRDNTIFEESTNTNGGGQYIFSGNTNNSFARRALLAYDLTGIPAGSTILSASLQLTVSKTIIGQSTQTLHALQDDWGEGTQDASAEEGQGTPPASNDATWVSNFHNTSTWTNPGGDYAFIASATAAVGANGSSAVWIGTQMVQDIQTWVDNPGQNFGWILIGDENSAQTAKRFISADHPTAPAGERPRLTVRYIAPSSVVHWRIY